jgi:hypothetical protein
VVIESQKIRGITDPKVLARLQAAMLAPPEPESAPKAYHHGPNYQYYRPWYERLLAKGCSRCGGEPAGWAQRQIQTPYRFKRTILWLVNLLPRGVSMIRVLLSRKVSSAAYVDRMASCNTCPSAVLVLRVVKSKVKETSHCGLCDCPKWYASRNAVRNKRSAWRCPAKLHAGSDRDAVLVEYVRTKAAQANGDSNNGR